jgi:hypothetical protein
MVEGTEEIGFRILYSPVSPVGSLDCFRDRLQNTFPYLRRQSQRIVRAFLWLLSTRVRLNARPKTSRDDNQFDDLVLVTRGGRDKTCKNPFWAQLATGHLGRAST